MTEVPVAITSLELDKRSSSWSSRRDSVVFYEARELNPKMALAQVITLRSGSMFLVPKKIRKSPEGS